MNILLIEDTKSHSDFIISILTKYNHNVKLLVDAINITNSNGVIVASTNYSNFNMKKFKSFIDLAFKDVNMKYQILETYSLPKDFYVSKDFPEGNYLKVVFIKKLS